MRGVTLAKTGLPSRRELTPIGGAASSSVAPPATSSSTGIGAAPGIGTFRPTPPSGGPTAAGPSPVGASARPMPASAPSTTTSATLAHFKSALNPDTLPPHHSHGGVAGGSVSAVSARQQPGGPAAASAASASGSHHGNNNTVEHLRQRVEAQQAELEQRTDNVNAIQRNFQRLSEMYAADRQRLVDAEARIVQLEQELASLQSERKVHKALQSEFVDLKTKATAAERDLTDRVADLKKENAKMQQALHDANAAHATAQAALARSGQVTERELDARVGLVTAALAARDALERQFLPPWAALLGGAAEALAKAHDTANSLLVERPSPAVVAVASGGKAGRPAPLSTATQKAYANSSASPLTASDDAATALRQLSVAAASLAKSTHSTLDAVKVALTRRAAAVSSGSPPAAEAMSTAHAALEELRAAFAPAQSAAAAADGDPPEGAASVPFWIKALMCGTPVALGSAAHALSQVSAYAVTAIGAADERVKQLAERLQKAEADLALTTSTAGDAETRMKEALKLHAGNAKQLTDALAKTRAELARIQRSAIVDADWVPDAREQQRPSRAALLLMEAVERHELHVRIARCLREVDAAASAAASELARARADEDARRAAALVSSLRSQLDAEAQNRTGADAATSGLRQQLAAANNEVSRLGREFDSATRDMAAKCDRIRDVEAQMARAHDEQAMHQEKARTAADALQARVRELEAQIANLRADLDASRAAARAADAAHAAAAEAWVVQRTTLEERVRELLSESQHGAAAAHDRAARLEAECAALTARLASGDAAAAAARAELEATRRSSEEAVALRDTAETAASRATARQVAAEAELARLVNVNNRSAADLRQVELQLSAARAEQVNLRARADALDAHRAAAEEKCVALKARVAVADRTAAQQAEWAQWAQGVGSLQAEAIKAVRKILAAEEACESGYSCQRCMELMKDPVTLAPCGHAFCRGCLPGTQATRYNDHRPGADRARFLPDHGGGETGAFACPECGIGPISAVVPSPILDLLGGKFAFRRAALKDLAGQLERAMSQSAPVVRAMTSAVSSADG